MAIDAWPATANDVRNSAASLVSPATWGARGPARTTDEPAGYDVRVLWLITADVCAVIITVMLARFAVNAASDADLNTAVALSLAGCAALLLGVQRGAGSSVYLGSSNDHAARRLVVAILAAAVLVDIGRELMAAPGSSLVAYLVLLSPILLSVPATRALTQTVLGRTGRESRVIVVGGGNVAKRVEARLRRVRGVVVVGRVDDDAVDTNGVIGTLAELPRLCADNGVDRVLVAFSRTPSHLQLERLRAASGTTISIVPRLYEMMPWGSKSDDFEGIPLIHIHQHSRRRRGALAVKRAIDLVGSAVLIALFSPVLLVVAIGIKLTSDGPVFFRQDRTGLDGRTFSIFKYRTMTVDAEQRRSELLAVNEVDGSIFKLRHDPRTFAFGRFLRKTSLDEIPQLFNVFRGTMSLVGPRPLPVAEAARVAPSGGVARTQVKPGITGVWQTCGRSALNGDDLEQLDAAYASSWSLAWDLQILLKTPACVLLRRGAY